MNYEEIEQSLKILKLKKINQISEIDFLWRKETQNKYNNFRKGKISKKVLNSNLQEINFSEHFGDSAIFVQKAEHLVDKHKQR